MPPESQHPVFQHPPISSPSGYHAGNAIADDVRGSGWFIGQFVPASLGLRHQDGVELKWGIHPRGERRPGGKVAYAVATTISIMLRGALNVTITLDTEPAVVSLRDEGDYIVFGPGVAHEWEALEDSVVLTVRFPSVDVSKAHQPTN